MTLARLLRHVDRVRHLFGPARSVMPSDRAGAALAALAREPWLGMAVLPWLEALATGAPGDDLLDLPLDVARDCAAVLADAHPPLREELRGLLAELVYEAGDELMVVAS